MSRQQTRSQGCLWCRIAYGTVLFPTFVFAIQLSVTRTFFHRNIVIMYVLLIVPDRLRYRTAPIFVIAIKLSVTGIFFTVIS